METPNIRRMLWDTLVSLELRYHAGIQFELVFVILEKHVWLWLQILEKDIVYVPWEPPPPQKKEKDFFPILEFTESFRNIDLGDGNHKLILMIKRPNQLKEFSFMILESLAQIEFSGEEFSSYLEK